MGLRRAPRKITVADLPPENATDAEFAAADKAHVDATDPHSQYVKKLASFESLIPAPLSLVAGSWQPLGEGVQVGQLGKGVLWDVMVYFQYDVDGIVQPYFQYCAGGTIGVIYWQADHLQNEGILLATEAHNAADFTTRFRFGQGNRLRKPEINPSRNINIVAPGFCQVSGVQKL